MLEVLLVFMMNGGELKVSDTVYSSYEDCETFVNTLVGQDVVNSDYAFQFRLSDGGEFIGQCIERSEYERFMK